VCVTLRTSLQPTRHTRGAVHTRAPRNHNRRTPHTRTPNHRRLHQHKMMGRAGRPGYDVKGVAVIMVHDPKKV
jgi:hypothetical protein